jgi:hypothetical protein
VAGTREFNGLRVMMALINNWDLKANNNSVYDRVEKVTADHVDFVMHSRPFFMAYVFSHAYYDLRTRMESVTRNIPIADARWLGILLGRLSTDQIGDCFRAGGFSPAEVEGYTRVVSERIEALKKL